MTFPTLPELIGGTQLIQPVPEDINWRDYFLDPWYLTERLGGQPLNSYNSGKKWVDAISKVWDTSIGLATDSPKIIVYTGLAAAIIHNILE